MIYVNVIVVKFMGNIYLPSFQYKKKILYFKHIHSKQNSEEKILKTPSWKNWGLYQSSGGETRTWTGDT